MYTYKKSNKGGIYTIKEIKGVRKGGGSDCSTKNAR
jgi:hypothetical protein